MRTVRSAPHPSLHAIVLSIVSIGSWPDSLLEDELRALEKSSPQKSCDLEHLRRFGMVIARRKQCKDHYAEVRGVLTYLAEVIVTNW